MNWFLVHVNDATEKGYRFVGTSEESLEMLVKKGADGEFIRLDNLLYYDRGVMKEWTEWDASLVPTIFINPKSVVDIMQFKGDPRTTSRIPS